jgi:hypothetical protein
MNTKKTILCIIIITALMITSLPISGSTAVTKTDSFFTNALVRIDTTIGDATLPRDIERVGENPGKWIDIIIPHGRLNELSRTHLSYSVLIDDVDRYSALFAGQYHSFAEIEQILHEIADNYPSITRLSSLGKSYENRDIWCLEISDNPGVDEDEPGVFFMGLHHAREWPTVEICLTIANRLTSLYGSNSTIQQLVDNRRVFLVPCMNPDGYYYTHDQGHDWRKNRHYFPEFGTTGVDLNRNYGGSCNGDIWGAWGSVGNGGASHYPDSDVYCGPLAFSENETQAIKNVFLENNICASITWHTYAEVVLWPWGYSTSQHAPDESFMAQIGQGIASRITCEYGSETYTPGQSSILMYPTTGDTCDWAYGYGHYILGRPTFTYTIEACEEFQPSASKLDQICNENFDGALYLLQEAENITTRVVPRVIPPLIDEMSYDADGNYTVSWDEQNPHAQPNMFQLDELTELSLVTDDAEAGSALWNLDGFSLSTSRSHSGATSYKSRHQQNDVSALTTISPLPVTEDRKLSFWCWYDIEENHDSAFVEVSTNGRDFETLETFTGISNNWEYKEYNLDTYAGDSLVVRFRYTTDSYTLNEGFYVDDISPVAEFGTITTLSDSLTGHSYAVTGKANGTYYYRVRGHNIEQGWGDYSTLEWMIVGGENDEEPPVVEITSPKERYLYLRNYELLPFFVTLIIGDITIEVNTFDNGSGIEYVEFYVDDQKMGTDTTAPYNWTWETAAFFRHTIKIVSIDHCGNDAKTELKIWKFL